MSQTTLGPHESIEIHELLNFKMICLTKSKLLQGIVFDRDLKALMQKDVEQSVESIKQLQELYQRFPLQ
ncbi:spore coat protein [Paenibacillus silviterrae]|uniref:spore coat protein n=1 Tax=Paenibacillus silviterrae TaxID=3242194 RepID=UPI0025433B57|nr:spore coat protein [Paenibacillus chinjuensis]